MNRSSNARDDWLGVRVLLLNASSITVLLTRLNSFVGTYMEREAEQLMVENLSKKYVTSCSNLADHRPDHSITTGMVV